MCACASQRKFHYNPAPLYPNRQMGKYKRKTNRAGFGQARLNAALAAIITEDRKIRETARCFKIPEATLRRHLKIMKNDKEQRSLSLGRAPVFTSDQANEIARYVHELSDVFFGITKQELCEIAYKYAEDNSIRHNFNRQTGIAGNNWYYNFLKRNPEIGLRKTETTNVINRTFNVTEVIRYFNKLKEARDQYEFPPDRIFNVDETEISTGLLGDAPKNATVICAMNPVGVFIPPLFVLHTLKKDLVSRTNAIYACTEDGRSNGDTFFIWLDYFQRAVACSADKPVLLILDNHTSHISLKVFDYCRENGIVLISVPSYTSRKLLPLVLALFDPLKREYDKNRDSFLKAKSRASDRGSELTPDELVDIFSTTYAEVANSEKCASGFGAAGIYPFDPAKGVDDAVGPAERACSPKPSTSQTMEESDDDDGEELTEDETKWFGTDLLADVKSEICYDANDYKIEDLVMGHRCSGCGDFGNVGNYWYICVTCGPRVREACKKH